MAAEIGGAGGRAIEGLTRVTGTTRLRVTGFVRAGCEGGADGLLFKPHRNISHGVREITREVRGTVSDGVDAAAARTGAFGSELELAIVGAKRGILDIIWGIAVAQAVIGLIA